MIVYRYLNQQKITLSCKHCHAGIPAGAPVADIVDAHDRRDRYCQACDRNLLQGDVA